MKLMRKLPALLPVLLFASLAQSQTGEEMYNVYCTQCHGTAGDGRGVNAAVMDVLPRSHIDPEEMGARQDKDLHKVIREGGKSINKSVLMPAWGHNLTDEQIDKLVRHLRVLCCGATP